MRWKRRLGPVGIAGELGVPASTVHAVLQRCGISRLSQVDRATGEPVRRYEWEHPGDLLHMDVKKLGNIPDGGGWRFLGREQGQRNRHLTPGTAQNKYRQPLMKHAFVHTVIDDHSRVAYAEIHDDETARTAIGVLRRAVFWFAARGVSVQRVLTDNGSCYRSHQWRQQCHDLDITHKRTRPYRPQTNGKVERFHRTMTAGWAFRRLYSSESAGERPYRPGSTTTTIWPHTALGKATPISRLTNLPGQYIWRPAAGAPARGTPTSVGLPEPPGAAGSGSVAGVGE